jgi:nitrite reductase (NADH) large subunit
MEFRGLSQSERCGGGARRGPSKGTADPRAHLVVIGNGMAGCRAVEELLARDRGRYRVTIFGAEPHVNYNRIMLSPVLAGEKTLRRHRHQRPRLVCRQRHRPDRGDPVVAVDRGRRRHRAVGPHVGYDRLLIATGSDPFIIPVPGKDLPGVISFRDMTMSTDARRGRKGGGDAVVIGGGLLGLEAAHGLTLRGMKVTVIHLMPTLMERQLDEAAGWLLKTALEARGQTILTGADTAEIVGDGKVEGVRLKDGRADPGEPRGDGGRHPPQCRAGARGRPRGRARHPGRRSYGHQRRGDPRGRRVRRA